MLNIHRAYRAKYWAISDTGWLLQIRRLCPSSVHQAGISPAIFFRFRKATDALVGQAGDCQPEFISTPLQRRGMASCLAHHQQRLPL